MLEWEAELSLVPSPPLPPSEPTSGPMFCCLERGGDGHSPYSCDSSRHPSVRRKEDGLQQSGSGFCW